VALYWHMGATATRLRRVRDFKLNGLNSADTLVSGKTHWITAA
jgi:hypothetical protein